MKLQPLTLFFIISLMAVGICAQDATMSDSSVAMRADIRKLFELTGGAKLSKEITNQVIAATKANYGSLSDEMLNDLFSNFDYDSYFESLVPIYEKYYTHDEIKQLIAFYESPLGQKMRNVMPLIMQEAMAASQEWSKKTIENFQKKLKSGKYDRPAEEDSAASVKDR